MDVVHVVDNIGNSSGFKFGFVTYMEASVRDSVLSQVNEAVSYYVVLDINNHLL